MKKILVFGSSNSSSSINKQLAIYAAQQLKDVELEIIDLIEYDLPIYSPDLERAQGSPKEVIEFNNLIAAVDGIVLSMAEYNGCYTAVFKNIFDWTSRIDNKVWKDKPMFLLGTSPGRRGAKGVLKIAKDAFPYFGGNIVADFSLPQFHHNFKNGEIIEEALSKEFHRQVDIYQAVLD